MKFLIMTDIEGVTGVTTFKQAENSEFGKEMLMNDLLAVIDALKATGNEAIIYDMHTDGRNVDIAKVPFPVVMGKPILGNNWRGVNGEKIDGLFLVGLHSMQNDYSLLAHSYLREYDAIYLNDILVGEIGIEAALAGEMNVPLKFVSGDDIGCDEAEALVDGIVTCAVKKSLTPETGLCHCPEKTRKMLYDKVCEAIKKDIKPFKVSAPYEIKIKFSQCKYLEVMKEIHPEIFIDDCTIQMRGEKLLPLWSEYLKYESEMVKKCQ